MKYSSECFILFKLNMKHKFQKVKTEHHLIAWFTTLLLAIEKHPLIKRIIPWRIDRQQKWSSEKRFRVTYSTPSGVKCIMSQWATAQELFIVCPQEYKDEIKEYLKETLKKFPEIKSAIRVIRELHLSNSSH